MSENKKILQNETYLPIGVKPNIFFRPHLNPKIFENQKNHKAKKQKIFKMKVISLHE